MAALVALVDAADACVVAVVALVAAFVACVAAEVAELEAEVAEEAAAVLLASALAEWCREEYSSTRLPPAATLTRLSSVSYTHLTLPTNREV